MPLPMVGRRSSIDLGGVLVGAAVGVLSDAMVVRFGASVCGVSGHEVAWWSLVGVEFCKQTSVFERCIAVHKRPNVARK